MLACWKPLTKTAWSGSADSDPYQNARDPQHCLADEDFFSYFATGAGTTLKIRCWFWLFPSPPSETYQMGKFNSLTVFIPSFANDLKKGWNRKISAVKCAKCWGLFSICFSYVRLKSRSGSLLFMEYFKEVPTFKELYCQFENIFFFNDHKYDHVWSGSGPLSVDLLDPDP